MITALSLLTLLANAPAAVFAPDTLRLEVGSAEVDGRVFPVHLARNRVYLGGGAPVTTWTNELSLGDSAGVPVMRWVTRGVSIAPEGGGGDWELVQTYDARTLQPLAYLRTASNGAYMRLRIEGNRVRGVQRQPGRTELVEIDRTIDRPGFFEGASDLIPMAVGLVPGTVMTAPVWAPGMREVEVRVFTVLDPETVSVEGSDVTAWKVEEHEERTGRLVATWWLTDESPFMVLGEIPLDDGRTQRITGVSLDRPSVER